MTDQGKWVPCSQGDRRTTDDNDWVSVGIVVPTRAAPLEELARAGQVFEQYVYASKRNDWEAATEPGTMIFWIGTANEGPDEYEEMCVPWASDREPGRPRIRMVTGAFLALLKLWEITPELIRSIPEGESWRRRLGTETMLMKLETAFAEIETSYLKVWEKL